MIVFIAGMPRSGSTFSLNVAREILCLQGRIHQEFSSSLGDVIANSGAASHIVWKGHEADEASMRLIELGSVKVICTFRKPEDAIASAMSTFDLSIKDGIKVMHQWLKMFSRLKHLALLIPYRQIDEFPGLAAWRIARYLEAGLSQWTAFPIARRYSKKAIKAFADRLPPDGVGIVKTETSYYDRETFIHRRHVSHLESKVGERILASENIALIRAGLVEFCSPNGEIDWSKLGTPPFADR